MVKLKPMKGRLRVRTGRIKRSKQATSTLVTKELPLDPNELPLDPNGRGLVLDRTKQPSNNTNLEKLISALQGLSTSKITGKKKRPARGL